MKRNLVFGVLFIALGLWVLHDSLGTQQYALLSYDVEIGDTPETMDALLSILESEEVTATFFVMGEFAEQFPEIVHRMDAIGEIACHTHTHPHMDELSYEAQESELVRCVGALSQALGRPVMPVGYRAPYHGINADTHEVLAELGFSYDASALEHYAWYFPTPAVPSIEVSSLGFMPLSDAVLIALPFPEQYFSLAAQKRAPLVSYLFHPHRAVHYLPYTAQLIHTLKQRNVQFITHTAALETPYTR